MKIQFHKQFEKHYKKLPDKLKEKVKERNLIFCHDPFDPMLNNHALKGKYVGYRSINVTGDIRIIYKLIVDDTALFCTIGTHSELYS